MPSVASRRHAPRSAPHRRRPPPRLLRRPPAAPPHRRRNSLSAASSRRSRRAETLRQTYALYLPSNYRPLAPLPSLYASTRSARHPARQALQRGRERFGWVVVGRTTRKRPRRRLGEGRPRDDRGHAGAPLVDARRVYAAGFSGGARQSILVDQLCRHCLAGVIAPRARATRPSASRPRPHLALFGVAHGRLQLPRDEGARRDARAARRGAPLRELRRRARRADSRTRRRAVEWMELQAIKSGLRPKDEAFAAGVWERRLAEARGLEAGSKSHAAYRAYETLAKDFRGLRDTSEADGRAAALGASKEVKAALRDEADVEPAAETLRATRRAGREAPRRVRVESMRSQTSARIVEGLRVKEAEADSASGAWRAHTHQCGALRRYGANSAAACGPWASSRRGVASGSPPTARTFLRAGRRARRELRRKGPRRAPPGF